MTTRLALAAAAMTVAAVATPTAANAAPWCTPRVGAHPCATRADFAAVQFSETRHDVRSLFHHKGRTVRAVTLADGTYIEVDSWRAQGGRVRITFKHPGVLPWPTLYATHKKYVVRSAR